MGEIPRPRRRGQRAVASEFSFMGPFAGVEGMGDGWGAGGEGEGWDLDRGRYEYFPNLSTLREDEDGGFGAEEEENARG